ncbi:hypothetical protein [Bacillus sp. 7884-1]|uniref:hypothetical protein n=1 Tax=Bacillus sp. 7884-1 TaxID=2021693 RepID=UPI000BA597A0|nr:hypothetical protein [Bacillus sp. 7884-1]PAE42723.1 hypothetical protein CHI06_10115 [Bacillus sp. 7884-1]
MQTDKDLFNLIKESFPLQPRQEFVSSTEDKLRESARKVSRRYMMKRLSYVSSGITLCVLAFSWFFFFNGKDIVLNTLTSLGANETQDENIRNMEAVLQNALTGPSDEFKEIINQTEWIEPLRQYEENRYKKYFADDTSYMEFVNSYGAVLMNTPLRNGYQLKVKNIEYEKIDTNDMVYNFSVELQYQKEGSELWEVETVSGQANLTAEHKLEGVVIRINDFLGFLDK